MALAPSDVHRRESIRKRILKTCRNVLTTALVITGISTIGLGINQAIYDHDASNLNQPIQYQTVTADEHHAGVLPEDLQLGTQIP